jgi:hypothetical protein
LKSTMPMAFAMAITAVIFVERDPAFDLHDRRD